MADIFGKWHFAAKLNIQRRGPQMLKSVAAGQSRNALIAARQSVKSAWSNVAASTIATHAQIIITVIPA
ncbi:MAG: hypothetical protein JWQ87_5287 [Candidatus Sulfotelmatobacter sp.]|nr:hypothetical protein [Candidatus Sulfotelmatobacter sp.]